MPPERLATLADWLALVSADDRERVATRFDERAAARARPTRMTYLVNGASGALLAATDEARAIRDHDGQLHRVVGIVRIAPAALRRVSHDGRCVTEDRPSPRARPRRRRSHPTACS